MIEFLHHALGPIEFENLVGLKTLRRQLEGVAEYITIHRYPLSDNHLVELFIGLEYQSVENMIRPFVKDIQSLSGLHPTIMVSQGVLTEGKVIREEVRDQADEQIISFQWAKWLKKEGLTWLEKHHDLSMLFEFYLAQPKLNRHPLFGNLRLLATAKLIDRPDIVQLARKLHQNMLRNNLPEHYIERFELMANAIQVPL